MESGDWNGRGYPKQLRLGRGMSRAKGVWVGEDQVLEALPVVRWSLLWGRQEATREELEAEEGGSAHTDPFFSRLGDG